MRKTGPGTAALLFLTLVTMLAGKEPPAEEVLERCIGYHDPSGEWSKLSRTLILRETRPGGTERRIKVTLDLPGNRFVYDYNDGKHHVVKRVENGVPSASLDGSAELSSEQEKRYRLSPEHIKRYRNYYLYLYGLPMKLRDPGTLLDPRVTRVTFQEREALRLKVTYDEAVGEDTWYFYVDPETYALTGCRFYHDESINDGEYITFEGEYRLGNLRIPRTREWYVNKDGKFLGSDILESHE